MVQIILALILALTGITRSVDPGLTALAETRAVQVSTDATFNHDGRRPDTFEVLAWNIGFTEPAVHAVEQWRGSPAHWEVLANPLLTRIGCGHAIGADGRDVFVCLLLPGIPVPSPVPPPVPTGVPPPTLLPNTAMSPP